MVLTRYMCVAICQQEATNDPCVCVDLFEELLQLLQLLSLMVWCLISR
jgi:hypothetical protein